MAFIQRALRRAVIAAVVVVAACGDGGNDEQPSAAVENANAPPVLEGVPGTQAIQNTLYRFAPAAKDADGDALVFGIDGKPAWATFDTTTGELSGVPTPDDLGEHRGIVIWASDGKAQSQLPPFDIIVVAAPSGPNRAPLIDGTPSGSVTAGVVYEFRPTASDPDGNSLTFSIANLPPWASFNPETGRLEGTPRLQHVGVYRNVRISVSDGETTAELPAFDITVSSPEGNSPPTISGAPPARIAVGSTYNFMPTASDVDGDPLVFSVANAPSWLSIDPRSGLLSGTPGSGVAGTFEGIVVIVSDGTASASLGPFAITVTPATTNTAPVITGAPAATAMQGVQYVFQPSAADPDGDTLRFTIANRPSWATFNANTGRLQGTPGPNHVGTYENVVISVSDGEVSTPLPAFSITVVAANQPPSVSGTPPATATVGTQYSFRPTVTDPNGDALTYNVTNLPRWATFNRSTGWLRGTPSNDDVGTYAGIEISVTDGQATARLEPFSIVVTGGANRAPTITGAPAAAIVVGNTYSFQPTARDPDGDPLTFSVANAPAWASLDSATGRLQGRPAAGDVGTTSGIVITVSDGKTSVSLPAFSITVQAVALGTATLTWTPPTANTDGSPLTNLAGYKVYWGPSAGNYTRSVTLQNPGLTRYVVENLAPGTYYFAVSAVSSAGVESAPSNPASKTIR